MVTAAAVDNAANHVAFGSRKGDVFVADFVANAAVRKWRASAVAVVHMRCGPPCWAGATCAFPPGHARCRWQACGRTLWVATADGALVAWDVERQTPMSPLHMDTPILGFAAACRAMYDTARLSPFSAWQDWCGAPPHAHGVAALLPLQAFLRRSLLRCRRARARLE